MTVELTNAQGRTLANLIERSYISPHPFDPEQAFPGKGKQAVAHRQNVRAMAEAGLFGRSRFANNDLIPDKDACLTAWNAWRDQHPRVEVG